MTEPIEPTNDKAPQKRKAWQVPELVVVEVEDGTGNYGTPPGDDDLGS